MKPLYRILIATGITAAVLASVYLAWWLFSDEPELQGPAAGGALPGEGTSTPATPPPTPGDTVTFSEPRVVSDHEVFDYWFVPDAREMYYLTPEGYLYAVKDGPDLEISRQEMPALHRTDASPDGRLLLAAFGNPAAPQWAVFDTVDAVWRPLPREITNAGWTRNRGEIVAFVQNGSDLNLSLVNILKSPPSYTVLLRNLRFEDVTLDTLDGGDIVITERGTAGVEGRVWRVNPATRTIVLALDPAAGRTLKIARGEGVTYLGSTDSFALADAELRNAATLFFDTLPDKCAAAASTTYCFAPKNATAQTVFPDDYFTRAFYSIDSLYRFDHRTGAVAPVFFGEIPIDASRVRVQKGAVYFIDRYTKKLFQLLIPTE